MKSTLCFTRGQNNDPFGTPQNTIMCETNNDTTSVEHGMLKELRLFTVRNKFLDHDGLLKAILYTRPWWSCLRVNSKHVFEAGWRE